MTEEEFVAALHVIGVERVKSKLYENEYRYTCRECFTVGFHRNVNLSYEAMFHQLRSIVMGVER